MNYNDSDLLMISALQHLLFCERQCALIHVEQIWSENLFTVRGALMHERTHSGEVDYRAGVRIERGIPLRSLRLGLVGKSDVVEFHRQDDGEFSPFPVEYKLGKPKANRCDEVQLCAQAICLEEMLGCDIAAGALFYGRIKRRVDVVFDGGLRDLTEWAASRLRDIVLGGITPTPVYDAKRCGSCSLNNICLPKLSKERSVHSYMECLMHAETS